MNKFQIILFTFFCSSCAVRSIYVPTNQNTMLFADKKEIKAVANVGLNTLQLQLGHNPLPHILVGINTCFGPGIGAYEGCIGHYNYTGNHRWRYELQGGGGYTDNFLRLDKAVVPYAKKINFDFETGAQYYKFYLQPAVGYFFNLWMYKLTGSVNASCRMSCLSFEKFVYRRADGNDPPTYLIDKEYHNKTVFLAEPCFTNKIGRQNLFAVFQAMCILPYSKQIDLRYTRFSPVLVFSVGVQYRLVLKQGSTTEQ
jgi:hypothetical protein